MTATVEAPGTKAITADLAARVTRFFTPYPRTGLRGSAVLLEVPHERLPRRADALVCNFLGGRPRLIGVEIKASRADWLRELANPDKAAAWAEHCCQWWVAAATGIVKREELPVGWGLLEPHRGTTMRQVVAAPTRKVETVPLWVVTAVAKKLDLTRADEVIRAVNASEACAQGQVARTQAQLARVDAQVAARKEDRNAEDAAALRALLAAVGAFGRPQWLDDPQSSPQGRALLAAVDGLARVLELRAETERYLEALAADAERVVARISRGLDTAERVAPRPVDVGPVAGSVNLGPARRLASAGSGGAEPHDGDRGGEDQ